MNHEFMEALEELVAERGLDKEILLDTIEQAIQTAYKKNFGSAQNVRIEFDESGVKVYTQRTVVDESDLYDNFLEIGINEARKINPNYEIGDIIEKEITTKNFGRIAAQTAKQVVIQRIREAERDIVYKEFMDKENEILTGEIDRVSKNVVYVNLGKIEGIMPQNEQIHNEFYKSGDKKKFYVQEVKLTSKGPQILLSRSNPGFVKRLFEEEVPEIFEGIVQIKSIARESGSRTKLAVSSFDEKIDPIGACVGPKGIRVKSVVDELGDEKIDIIKYDDDMSKFISSALSPSKVVSVEINEEEKSAFVVVPDDKLSLAIGKEGQNARLAAKLTNWKIDIKSESQEKEIRKNQNMLDKENNNDLADDISEGAFESNTSDFLSSFGKSLINDEVESGEDFLDKLMDAQMDAKMSSNDFEGFFD
ncbi:MAG: transcription termination factor NusA, partial [Clostridioides sp.]|nr:transcription termination factor NusA [Clostridioides sp.]